MLSCVSARTSPKTTLASDLYEALVSCPSPLSVDRATQLACHLALPTTDLLGMQARIANARLTWRDLDVVVPLASNHASLATSDDLRALAAFAAELQASYRATDQFLDPTANPETWVKIVASGSRCLVVGPEIVFQTPPLTIERDVDAACLHAVIDHLRAQPSLNTTIEPLGLQLSGSKEGVLVSRCIAVLADLPSQLPTNEVLGNLGRSIAREIEGELVTMVDLAEPDSHLAHVEFLFEVGSLENISYEALIAAHVDGLGAAAIGYPGTWVPSNDTLPGWRVLGRALHEPGLVATHPTSHLRALLRPRTSSPA